MPKAKVQARHRRACRPVTPLSNLSLTGSFTPIRGVAATSVTGIAISVFSGGIAAATPENAVDVTPKTLTNSAEHLAMPAVNPAVVAPSDIEWTAGDEVAVEAEAPVVETPEAQGAANGGAAGRGYERVAYSAPAGAPVSGAAGLAMQYLGVPYVWGGGSPAGFDCSGLVQYVYGQLGYSLPHNDAAIAAMGTPISAAEAQPGDLVHYPYGHIGIYAGDGMMIHATMPGRYVEYEPIFGSGYYFVRL